MFKQNVDILKTCVITIIITITGLKLINTLRWIAKLYIKHLKGRLPHQYDVLAWKCVITRPSVAFKDLLQPAIAH